MLRIHFAALPALLCLALAATGCSSPTKNGDATEDPSTSGAVRLPSLTGTEWICIELVGPDGTLAPVTDRPPTIVISADGKVSGFAGVNRFFTEASFGNSITAVTPLTFGPVGATRMAGPPERMQLEGAFTSMLERVRAARVVAAGDDRGDARATQGHPPATLVMSGDSGVVARFVRVPIDAGATP